MKLLCLVTAQSKISRVPKINLLLDTPKLINIIIYGLLQNLMKLRLIMQRLIHVA